MKLTKKQAIEIWNALRVSDDIVLSFVDAPPAIFNWPRKKGLNEQCKDAAEFLRSMADSLEIDETIDVLVIKEG